MSAEGASRCRAERRRLSWALTVLTLAAITSSSLSALSLYRALALQAEVEVLRTEVNRRREAQGGVAGGGVGEPQRAAEEDREDAEVRCACGSEAARPRRARYVCNARALPFRRRRSAARPLERLLSGFFRGPSRPQTPWWARSAAPPEDRSEPSLKKRSLGREPAQTGKRFVTPPPPTPHPPGRPAARAGSLQILFQPCLQMMADSRRKPYQKGNGKELLIPALLRLKSADTRTGPSRRRAEVCLIFICRCACARPPEFALDVHVAVPWQTGLKRGTALEGDQDDILVREEGYYFIYSQVEHYDQPEVFYKDPKYAMGHIVLRTKQNVVGDESQHVVLFRCVQSMNAKVPYNTCFTGGIVKLESGDRVELLIPRSTANISLDGDSTFLGAVKLA
ncbi:hypothetical protein P4O66_007947 [Electrophorus voltai]|uniref:THD domain-containing protein n=1 Tax=Electrophorus voltai TaxID=2609070 RepID=A0AAD8ZG30_9TELE|nr:hypothetical protein P4O66_007947 [Electrophorus voltai]